MNRTKVLYIHHTTAIGGATNSLLFTIENLPKVEYDVFVLFLQAAGNASELFKNKGISVDHITDIYNYQHAFNSRIRWFTRNPIRPITQFVLMLMSVPKLIQYFKKKYYDIDIVHINTSVMLPVGIACKILGFKVVWHIREVLYPGLFGLRKYIVANTIRWCSNKIIHICKMGMKSSINSKKNEVIYNFINFNKFDKNLNKYHLHDELNKSNKIKFITMLGGIVHSKGADVFLKAIPLVTKHFPDTHFLVVGYPPVVKNNNFLTFRKSISLKCLELVEEFNLGNKVSFIGLRNDIPAILASSYVLVWPASVPHFSRPIMEAQAMGIPAIGTDFEVTREIIKDNETGLLFKNHDEVSLSNQIIKLLSDIELHSKISNQGYIQAYKMFNAEYNVSKIIQIYKSLN